MVRRAHRRFERLAQSNVLAGESDIRTFRGPTWFLSVVHCVPFLSLSQFGWGTWPRCCSGWPKRCHVAIGWSNGARGVSNGAFGVSNVAFGVSNASLGFCTKSSEPSIHICCGGWAHLSELPLLPRMLYSFFSATDTFNASLTTRAFICDSHTS